MRLFKLFTTALLVAVIVLFVRQNMTTFQTSLPFTLDLYVTAPAHWSHHLYGVILISGLLGLLIGLAIMAKPYLNLRRAKSRQRRDERDKPIKRSLISRGKPAVGSEKDAGANSAVRAETESETGSPSS